MEITADSPFSSAFDHASGAIGTRFQNPLWRLTDLIFGHQLRRSLTKVKSFGQSIVAAAVQKRSSQPQAPAEDPDAISGSLINLLLDNIPSHSIVADAALNYLSAGPSLLTLHHFSSPLTPRHQAATRPPNR